MKNYLSILLCGLGLLLISSRSHAQDLAEGSSGVSNLSAEKEALIPDPENPRPGYRFCQFDLSQIPTSPKLHILNLGKNEQKITVAIRVGDEKGQHLAVVKEFQVFAYRGKEFLDRNVAQLDFSNLQEMTIDPKFRIPELAAGSVHISSAEEVDAYWTYSRGSGREPGTSIRLECSNLLNRPGGYVDRMDRPFLSGVGCERLDSFLLNAIWTANEGVIWWENLADQQTLFLTQTVVGNLLSAVLLPMQAILKEMENRKPACNASAKTLEYADLLLKYVVSVIKLFPSSQEVQEDQGVGDRAGAEAVD